MPVQLTCVELDGRLPADTELALYRIFQDALKTIEQHARTRRVTVNLSQSGDHVQLTIQDDGAGYNPDKLNGEKNGLGLLGMRERATYVGGTLTVKSARRSGTTIEVRIPLPVVVNVAADKTP
jgi:signal transduction histidine kinase